MNAEPSDPPATTGGAPWSFQVVDADPLVASIAGEIDTLTGPLVQEHLVDALEASNGPVRLEIADISFIDSQGLSALISVSKQYPDRQMTLAGARPNIRRLIDITGLGQVFEIE